MIFFFLEETEFHPAFRKHLFSPTSQVLLPLSGQRLGKANPFWLTGQALVPIPLRRLWGGGGAVSLKSFLGCTHRCGIRDDGAGSDHQAKPNLPLSPFTATPSPSNKTESRKQGCLFNCNQICCLKSARAPEPGQGTTVPPRCEDGSWDKGGFLPSSPPVPEAPRVLSPL